MSPLSSRPYFTRKSIREDRYTLLTPQPIHRPASPPPAVAVARYTVSGVPVEMRETVRRREPKLPYGDDDARGARRAGAGADDDAGQRDHSGRARR